MPKALKLRPMMLGRSAVPDIGRRKLTSSQDMGERNETFTTAVPLQPTEDHLGRLLGREAVVETEDLTARDERDRAIDDDDESLLPEIEVENAEDDVVDADNDDSLRSNNLTPIELTDSSRATDAFSTQNEDRSREGHTISPEDKPAG